MSVPNNQEPSDTQSGNINADLKARSEVLYRKRRALIAQLAGVIAMLIGLLAFIALTISRVSTKLDIGVLLSSLGGMVAMMASVLLYLRPKVVVESTNSRDLPKSVRRYVDETLKGYQKIGSTADHAALLEEAQPSNSGMRRTSQLDIATEKMYIAEMELNVTAQVKAAYGDKLFQQIIERLTLETESQAKRGNLNLALGMTVTVSGLAVLAYTVFNSPSTENLNLLFAYFVPRVSMVIVIEVFAYFFLKLYKQSLAEIKYFQNEITNIEARSLAFFVAHRSDDPGIFSKIVDQLVVTERNFVLSKDQTTVELERERINQTTYSDALSALRELIKKKDG